MTKVPTNTTSWPEPATYEIRLLGHLDMRWATQLDAVTLAHQSDGTTLLNLAAADQAALHGLLQRIRDLGLVLISVARAEPAAPADTSVHHQGTTMKITSQDLIRWSGPAVMMAGVSYVLVGVFHPPNVSAAIITTPWLVVHILAMGTSIFGMLGLTGLYARQAEQTGWAGLAGYLLLNLWLALILGFTFVEVFILPPLATIAPAFVDSWLGMFNGTASAVDLGGLPIVWMLSGPLYILGGITFGIATVRAGVLPRGAGLLLATGTAMGPLAALLPLDLQPKIAVPAGLALAWLGYALWSNRRMTPAHVGAELRPI